MNSPGCPYYSSSNSSSTIELSYSAIFFTLADAERMVRFYEEALPFRPWIPLDFIEPIMEWAYLVRSENLINNMFNQALEMKYHEEKRIKLIKK